MYQNERFCRPPIDLLLQWQARRTLHNRAMTALEPKEAARYLQLESKIRYSSLRHRGDDSLDQIEYRRSTQRA
jgi:hypothetical protein